jgi:hypothetical protein
MQPRVKGGVLSPPEKSPPINPSAAIGQTQTDRPGRCRNPSAPNAVSARVS